METLTVHFRTGGVYDYIGVPSEVAEEMVSAPSKGRYLRTNIVPKYEYIIKAKPPRKKQ